MYWLLLQSLFKWVSQWVQLVYISKVEHDLLDHTVTNQFCIFLLHKSYSNNWNFSLVSLSMNLNRRQTLKSNSKCLLKLDIYIFTYPVEHCVSEPLLSNIKFKSIMYAGWLAPYQCMCMITSNKSCYLSLSLYSTARVQSSTDVSIWQSMPYVMSTVVVVKSIVVVQL